VGEEYESEKMLAEAANLHKATTPVGMLSLDNYSLTVKIVGGEF
jgi:hypothetical protein